MINDCFQKFYETLYTSESDNNTLTSDYFLDGLKIPQLTDEQAKLLEGPVT